ncbi:MAG: hypothetical protein ABW148_03250 [Sedimenticola sp.]
MLVDIKKNRIEWLIVSLLSAGSRILETVSMILPLKAIFVMMKPEALPDIWHNSGFELFHLIISIMILVLITFLLGKILHVLARRRAHNLYIDDAHGDADSMAMVTIKITSSFWVMLVFTIIMAITDIYALVLIALLIFLSFMPLPMLKTEIKQNFYKLLGISKTQDRFRFISQLLFLVYFMSLLTLIILQDEKVTVLLLLSVLIGRKYLMEFARLRVGLLQREKLKNNSEIDLFD